MESLIFDIDGTIWDSRELVAKGYNAQLEQEGYSRYATDPEKLKALFGKSLHDFADGMFPGLPEQIRYPLMERCMHREKGTLEADPCQIGYPGIEQTVRALARTHRLFIVSNSQKGYPALCLEKLGLQDCFAGHLCYGDTLTPKGETIQTLMKTYGITSACYIGDTQGDWEASQAAGLPFVWASYGFGEPEAYTYRISAPAELLELEKEGKL